MAVEIEESRSTSEKPAQRSRAPLGGLTLGLVAKIIFLSTINATSLWTLGQLIPERVWLGVAFVVLATVAIDVVYLTKARWAIPIKYLLPGTLFLLAFQVYPVIYTAYISTTNLGTGNILDKDAAIEQVISTSVGSTESGISYVARAAQSEDGTLGIILIDQRTDPPEILVGTNEELIVIDPADVVFDGERVQQAGAFTALNLGQAADFETELSQIAVPAEEGVIVLKTFSRAAVVGYSLQYDEAADVMRNVETGVIYRPVDGFFRAESGARLNPGWQINIGFENYERVFASEAIRGPFLRVFVWNWAFAAGTVFFGFALGLLLAITLDHPDLRGKRFYRSFLIFPYALPSFLTVLVWQGMMNRDFGIINDLTGLSTPWLTNPWMARGSVLLVSTWLTFPYFFLVSTGALQSIPKELTEAANVDGASGPQAFGSVTLPLLLIAVAPLMIASFAFNFNNFNVIYMLNRGGPPIPGAQTPAGSTDILVSYTFRLAFESGRGQDLAFATAISILIFLHVAMFSAWSFRKTAKLEEI
ncbi:MAG: ABC transporter permease subunit [Acidimicrobiales bacterium]|nr:ABC transporter permease subunit [Acidimicrobiales bacterium]